MVVDEGAEAVPDPDTEDDVDVGDDTDEVEAGDDVDDDAEESVAGVELETGQTVVETAMVDMTTVVESLGQLVTVGAQLTMV